MLTDIIDGIELQQTGYVIRGRQRLMKLFTEFHTSLDGEIQKTPNADHLDVIQRTYEPFFEHNEHHLGHYFRHLYHIVAFVDRSTLPVEEKITYVKLLRAQLSSHELLLLFYNCLSKRGIRKFKPLIEKYALLEHMPKLVYDHRPLYADSAFKEDK